MKHIFKLDNWRLPPKKWINTNYTNIVNSKSLKRVQYVGLNMNVKDTYCYLKARFGEPNGNIKFLKLYKIPKLFEDKFYWNYIIEANGSYMYLWGNSNLNIIIHSIEQYDEEDFNHLIKLFHIAFKNNSDKKKQVEKQLSKYAIMINPYKRLYDTVDTLLDKIDQINPSPPKPLKKNFSKPEEKYYKRYYRKWIHETDELTNLCLEARMLIPVLCETFINLIIFVQRRKKYVLNNKEYETKIREGIRDRLSNLHNTCFGFITPIDLSSKPIKDFFSVMNRRNDFLHGNIRPQKMKFETLYLDKQVMINLNEFELHDNIINNYNKMLLKDEVFNDFEIAEQLKTYILSCLDEQYRNNIQGCLSSRIFSSNLIGGGTTFFNVPDEVLFRELYES